MLRALIVVLLPLLLSACGGPIEQWQHRSGDPLSAMQLQRDKSDCHMYIDAGRQDSFVLQQRPVFEWEDEFAQCMSDRGWFLQRIR